MKVFVIGGGVSGLVCSITLARRGYDVTVLEKNSKIGKKILITGNGHCNYMNEDFKSKYYHSSNIDIVDKYICDDNKKKILSFYDSIGIVPYIKNGYYYPMSNVAVSVQNAFLMECNRLGINIVYDCNVNSIEKKDKFIIHADKEYYADRVVLAIGGIASEKSGSDGIGFKWLEDMGHSIVKVVPALVQICSKKKYDWHGIRNNCALKLRENGNIIACEGGEVLFTDYGISGICSMNLSGTINRGLELGCKEEIIIDFVPGIDINCDYLDDRYKRFSDRNIIEMLEGLVNYKLLMVILNGFDLKKKWINFSEHDKNTIINRLKAFVLEVNGTKNFDNAQVSSGGLLLEEVSSSFESKIVPGLYVAGELLDVDGNCGGYNIGFYSLTGIIIGKNML